jgi:hypothetical protein
MSIYDDIKKLNAKCDRLAESMRQGKQFAAVIEGGAGKSQPERPEPSQLLTEAVATLRGYNRWRRGDENYTQPCPRAIGQAIDAVVDGYEALLRERDEALLELGAIHSAIAEELDLSFTPTTADEIRQALRSLVACGTALAKALKEAAK